MVKSTSAQKISAQNSILASMSASTMSRSSVALECNYEEDCPPLYEAIEAAATEADFARILFFLEKGEWKGTALFSMTQFAKNASPVHQAQTWVTRFDEKDENKVMWSQLPLHLAIVCSAPVAVIRKLVQLYPQGLRCTDDQHMLPLHLALRQNASDDVVAFLAMEFPEAVNTKGKNGRTAIESALRAKDKHRGLLLDVFVDRTKSRLSSAVINEREMLKTNIESKEKDVTMLKAELETQYSLAERLRADLSRNKTELENTGAQKDTEEAWLQRRINELETRNAELEEESKTLLNKARTAKLVETLELQSRAEELESCKTELKCLTEKTRADEASLCKELDMIHQKVAMTQHPEDWIISKNIIEALRLKHLKTGIAETKGDLETLKDDISKTWSKAASSKDATQKAELKAELRLIKKSIEHLQSADVTSINSLSSLLALRDEVKALRVRLTSRTDVSKLQAECIMLNVAMESELRNSDGKSTEEIEALRRAVMATCEKELTNKTPLELAKVKSDVTLLQRQITENELETTIRKDLDELELTLKNTDSTANDPKVQVIVSSLKDKVIAIRKAVGEQATKAWLGAIKSQVEILKDEMKNLETTEKLRLEAEGLKTVVDEELQQSQGSTHQELLEMKETIRSLVNRGQQTMGQKELSKVKGELSLAKQELQAKLEVAVLKKSLEIQIHNSTNMAEKELTEMRNAVELMEMDNKESKKLKESLTEEIKVAKDKTEKELLELKKALEGVNLSRIASKNLNEWQAARRDMESLKKEIQEKKVVEFSTVEQELLAVKKVVEAVNVRAIESKNKSEFRSIRAEMEALKKEMKYKDDSKIVLKRAVEDIIVQVQDGACPPGTTPKDKTGLKKFLSRRFSRKSSSDTNDGKKHVDPPGYLSAATFEHSEHDMPSTIHPPSMNKTDNCSLISDMTFEQSDARSWYHGESKSSSQQSETKSSQQRSTKTCLPPVVPLRQKGEESLVTPKTTNKVTKALAKAFSPTKAAKTKSNSDVPIPLEPYSMTRTRSKAHIADNGEVELEVIGAIA